MAKRPSKKPKRTTIAASADPYVYYQRAVQAVDAEIDFVDETFTSIRKRKAVRLREDFCGTANTSCEWVRRRRTNSAVGLDLDPVPLGWGREHNLSKLKPAALDRIRLDQADVLKASRKTHGAFDIVLAMNFSYWCFKLRATMLDYFRAVRESLATDGVFFLDFYGGPDALREVRERRRIGGKKRGFWYIWDQKKYNPITGDKLCHIHFKFDDGSWLRKAFTYDWRLWTIPEIRDLLAEAGFKRSTVYWEGDDKDGGGDGDFKPTEVGDACLSYICYISAEK